MATELLGFNKKWLKEKTARLVGKDNADLVFKAHELIDTYMKSGWSGIWDDHIAKGLQGINNSVTSSITGWLQKTVVIEAVKYIVSLFNPVAALVKAIKMGLDIYSFIKDNFKKMYSLVSGFVNELANIAQGNLSNAIKFVENALGDMLSLGIKLLAKLLNVDKISRAVNEALEKMHDRIDGVFDTFIDWIKVKASDLLGIDPAASPTKTEVASEPKELPKP